MSHPNIPVQRHSVHVLALLLIMSCGTCASAGEPSGPALDDEAWVALERQIAEQEDTAYGGHDSTQPIVRGGTSGHGLVRTGVVAGDYQGLPPQTDSPGPEFGYSVAMDGDWLVVGAPGTLRNVADLGGVRTFGAVFVFKREAGGWQLKDRLAINHWGDMRCGTSVAIRLPLLAYGCPGAGNNAEPDGENGLVAFYRLSSNESWIPSSVSTGATLGSECGRTVALSQVGATSDTLRAAWGCPGWFGERGEVLVRTYHVPTQAFSSQTNVTAGDGAAGDRFGDSLAIFRVEVLGVGVQRLAVGAPFKSFPPGFGNGKVYLFEGADWDETATFTPPAPESFSVTFFGGALAMNNTQLIVGVRGGFTSECPNAPRCGQVIRYERSGSNWQNAGGGGAVNAGGNPPGEQVGMRFGAAVAMGFDNWVAVAAPHASGNAILGGSAAEIGMVELRRADGGGWGVSWSDHQGEVRPGSLPIGLANAGHFGTSVAFGGRRLSVGYPHAGTTLSGNAIRRGQVWIYEEDRIFADDFEQSP